MVGRIFFPYWLLWLTKTHSLPSANERIALGYAPSCWTDVTGKPLSCVVRCECSPSIISSITLKTLMYLVRPAGWGRGKAQSTSMGDWNLNEAPMGLDYDFPDEVFVLEKNRADDDPKAIYCKFTTDDDVSGLVVCSTIDACNVICYLTDIKYNKRIVPFQFARKLAQDMNDIECVIFMDDPENPKLHYVK